MPEDNNTPPTDSSLPVSRTVAQEVSPTGTFEPTPNQKPSKWRYFFIVLGILQIAGLAIFFLFMAWVIQRSKAKPDISGIEFIDLIVFITLVPAIGLIAFINLVGLPLYMRRHKPQGKWLVFSIISLVVSAMLALFGAYNIYQFWFAIPNNAENLYQQSEQNARMKNYTTP